MNLFVESVASVLEVDQIGLDDRFRDVAGWCSLYGFGLLVLLENDWGAPTDLATFQSLTTVRDLYRVVLVAFIADFLNLDRSVVLASAATLRDMSKASPEMLANLRAALEKKFGVSYPVEMRFEDAGIDDLLV